jgi:hypothetical protein
MSLRYKGGVISATPPTTTGGESGSAPGVWTVEQQFQAQGAGNWPSPYTAKYIEDYFSTYVYSGNGGNDSIVNNVNLLTTGSSATTGTDIGSALGGISVASDGSYAITAGNAVLKITAANTLDWQRGDTNINFMNCVIDSSGNVYAIGYSGSTAYFCKYNSSGTQQWFKSCSSTAPDDVMGMEITSDGNLFLGWGATSGTAVSMKVDSSNGSILWQKLLTDTSLKCQDVATDSSGNCYQYGYAGSTRYPFIVKYDSSGNVTWQRKLTDVSATGLFAYGIGVDSSGNVFAACYLGSGGTNRSFIVKLDSSGSLTAQRGSTATNSTAALCIDSSGNVYYSSGYRIFKYDNSLTFQWVRTVSREPVRSGLSTSSTQIYITSGSGPVYRLNIDGTTVQGVSSTDSGISYTNPASTDNASTSISASTASISFSSGSYSVSNYTPANNTSYTATAQTFPAIAASGGLVWIKTRNVSDNHFLFDTLRGPGYYLATNLTGAQGGGGSTTFLNAFNRNGFSIGSANGVNGSGEDLASWTFREQAKFFDVVTFTTSSSTNTNQRISHNLASVPGCIIVKNTGGTSGWPVWHRSLPTATSTYFLLNTTDPESTYSNCWGTSGPTSTDFGINTNFFGTSANYVAYIFAHDAGGFGLTGSDNVITCGSFNASSGAQDITLGYEPQLVFLRESTNGGKWEMIDNIRGFSADGNDVRLAGNSAIAENTLQIISPSATGFRYYANLGGTVVYVAIRRGPMNTPTVGTSVYNAVTWTGNNAARTITGLGFPLDLAITKIRNNGGTSQQSLFFDRLRGSSAASAKRIAATSTNAETNYTAVGTMALMDGFRILDGDSLINDAGIPSTYIGYFFRRAPGAFDVVCYTGTGSATTFNHNLGIAPELIICKNRSVTTFWAVYSANLGNTQGIELNSTSAASTQTAYWNSTSPTSSVFTVGTDNRVNGSGNSMVAYLFATVSGVSKVGSYTGTGALQTVNCGFTTGARFVLIKRTDASGDWYLYDSARGISSGNDPYFFMNSVAAEVTNTNYVDTTSSGFQVTAAAPSALNASGGTYIFLAIA